jgi:putative peptidoglycan lipid II flippase
MILPLVLRMWATRLGEGSVAALAFASQLAAIPSAFIVTPVGIVLLPQLAHALRQQAGPSATTLLKRAFAIGVLPTAAVGIVLAIFADQIVAFAFKRGRFTIEDVYLTAGALRFLGYGLFAVASTNVIGRAFFAAGRAWSFAAVWLIALGLSVAVGSLGALSNSVSELAALYSGAYVLQFALLAALALRRSRW